MPIRPRSEIIDTFRVLPIGARLAEAIALSRNALQAFQHVLLMSDGKSARESGTLCQFLNT
jgi:hypothetical protein